MIIRQIKHENKVGKSGKPFESCKILTTNSQGQDVWVSGFGNEITHTWKVGHSVDVSLSQNDRGYWNFELNQNSKAMPSEELELLKKINEKLDLLLGSKVSNYEVSTEDIPF